MAKTLLCFFTFLLLGSFTTSTTALAEEVSLEKLQAAYIFKFTNYIEWPAQNSNPFIIGVMDDTEMFEALNEAFKGKTIQNQAVTVLPIKKLDKKVIYNILLINNSDASLTKDLSQINSSGLLTVSYSPHGLPEKVVINFYMGNQDHLRFEINNEQAGKNNLKINSRLLNLARSSK